MRVLVLAIILIFLILIFSKTDILAPLEINKKKIIKRRNQITNIPNKPKVLKYFGQDYCQYSNKQSYMYNVLNTKFRKMYPNVQIEFNWGKTQYEMNESNRANVEYVPTITNENYKNINVYISDKLDNQTERQKLVEIYESVSPA